MIYIQLAVAGVLLIGVCEASVLTNLQKVQTNHQASVSDPSQQQQINKFPSAISQLRSSETQSPEPMQIRSKLHALRKFRYYNHNHNHHDSEKAIRVTINDLRNRYVRLENMIGILERVSYAISKPVAIVDAIRLFALALSSVLMSTLNYS